MAVRTAEQVAQVQALLQRMQRVPERSGPPNILLVGFDTVRADRTSVYGHSRPTTPNLAALAARGVVFESAIANSNESLYAHTNLWTARYASEVARPVYETFVLPETATTMAEVLGAYGYATGGFVAGGHLDADFGLAQGFDSYQAQVGFGSLWSTVPQALEWIDARDPSTPWMAYVHGYDAHGPYRTASPFGHRFYPGAEAHPADTFMVDPMLPERIYKETFYPGKSIFFVHPKGFRILSTETYVQIAQRPEGKSEVFDAEAADHLRAHYDGCLAYADLQLGLLLAALEDRGLLEQTLVVVLGDHGEDLLDHDFVNHRTGLYEGIIKVPLVIAGPGFEPGQRVSGLVEALDVLPTVLRAAGAERPAGSRGRALQDVAAGTAPALQAVFSEGVMHMISVRTSTHKLIARGFPLAAPDLVPALAAAKLDPARFELFDLEADPGESRNLLDAPSETTLALAADLRAQLLRWRVDLAIGTAAQDPSRIDPMVVEQLRRHGYWRAP
jgi:arylsulfatase A-like enzyme